MNNDEILAQLRAKQETLQKELNDLEKQANEIRNQPDKIEELELIESKITTVQVKINDVGNEIKIEEEKQKIPEPSKGLGDKVKELIHIAGLAVNLTVGLAHGTSIPQHPEPLPIERVVQLPSNEIAVPNQKIDSQTCEINKTGESEPQKSGIYEVNSQYVQPLTVQTTDSKTPEEIADEKNRINEHQNAEAYQISKERDEEKNIPVGKDPAIEWKKDIDKKEQSINEKYDNKINEIEKNHEKLKDIIEKKDFNKEEKETKTKELTELIGQVKDISEKGRKEEIEEKIKPERERLDLIKEAASRMDYDLGRKFIEEQHKEFERQRQLAEQNRNR